MRAPTPVHVQRLSHHCGGGRAHIKPIIPMTYLQSSDSEPHSLGSLKASFDGGALPRFG